VKRIIWIVFVLTILLYNPIIFWVAVALSCIAIPLIVCSILHHKSGPPVKDPEANYYDLSWTLE
jgi:hypothetical protein